MAIGPTYGLINSSIIGFFGCSPSPEAKAQRYLKEIQKDYPDLRAEDQELLKEFYLAKDAKRVNPQNYEQSLQNIFEHLAKLIDRLQNQSFPGGGKFLLIGRLINFQVFFKNERISLSQIKKSVKIIPPSESITPKSLGTIWTSPTEISISGIKELVQKDKAARKLFEYLSLEKEKGYSYFEYLLNHTNSIVFLPHLKDHIKRCNSQSLGTAEELSKTIIVDTDDERGLGPRNMWDMVSTLIHEAAHIEYYQRYLGSIDEPAYERYACETQLKFLKTLWENKHLLPLEQHSRVAARIKNLEDRIKKGRF